MSEDVPQAQGSLAAGSRIAGYLLQEQIGEGGMAVVFRAQDEKLGRRVALKLLAPALAADEAFRQRFIRESQTAAAVDNPHIIPLFEAGEADGVLYIAMRYVPGGDVRTLLDREGPLPPARAAQIISQAASALDAAHARGLVHRDVKPANMLLDATGASDRPDHVYLSDFGLSKQSLATSGLTGSGQFLGTVDYIAPEQIAGRPVDGRADQYSLACAAFELLTGTPPFRRQEAVTAIYAQLHEPPPPVTSSRPDLPPGADQVFARALAKAPESRYPACREFAEALRWSLMPALAVGAPHDASMQPPGYPHAPIAPSAAGAANTTGPAMPGQPQGPTLAAGQVRTPTAPPAGIVVPGMAAGSLQAHEPTRRRRHRRLAVTVTLACACIAALTVTGLALTGVIPLLHHPSPRATSTSATLVRRSPPGGGYSVLLPAGWKFRNASYPSDHSTHLWYDPASPLQKMEVILSGCVGCADRKLNPSQPDPGQLVPAGAVSHSSVNPWETRYEAHVSDDALPDDGEVIVTRSGTQVSGYIKVDLWLPARQHTQAADILRSFTPSSPGSGSEPPPASTVLWTCYGTSITRPASYILACADGNSALKSLTWTSWTAARAIGRGKYSVNNCLPDCADGTFITQAVRVTLSDPASGPHSTTYFTRLLIRTATGQQPYALRPGGPVFTTVAFTCQVASTAGGLDYEVTAVDGGPYTGTVQISFYDYAGSGHTFSATTIQATASRGSQANWHPVPAADIGASAEPSGCNAYAAG